MPDHNSMQEGPEEHDKDIDLASKHHRSPTKFVDSSRQNHGWKKGPIPSSTGTKGLNANVLLPPDTLRGRKKMELVMDGGGLIIEEKHMLKITTEVVHNHVSWFMIIRKSQNLHYYIRL